MDTITRKAFRDIRAQKYLFIAIVILVGLGISLYTGFILAYDNLDRSYTTTYEKLSFQDFSVDIMPIPEDKISLDIEGIEHIESRYILDTGLYISESEQTRLRIIAMSETPTVNQLRTEIGDFPGKKECIVNTHLADFYGLKLGDTIFPFINGERVPMKISGIAGAPEYLIPSASEQDIMPSPGSFGVIFVSKDYMHALLGEPLINNICFIFKEGYNKEKGIEDITSALGTLVHKVTRKEDVPSHKALKLDLEGFREMAYFFPFVVLVIAALSLFTMISRLVESQRKEIGVLRAMGVSKYRILLNYVIFSLSIGGIGAVIGIILGWWLTVVCTNMYAAELGIPYVRIAFEWSPLIEAVGASFLVCIVAGFLPSRQCLHMQPAQALHTVDSAAKGVHMFPLSVPFSMRVLHKLPFKNIVRTPKRTLFTVAGLAFAIMIVVLSVGIADSMDYTLSQQYGEVYTWDIRVELGEFMHEDKLHAFSGIEGVSAAEPVIFLPARVISDTGEEFMPVVALQENTRMQHFENVKISPGKAYVSLIKKSSLDLEESDTITVETYFGTEEFSVGGFPQEYLGGYLYLEYNTARDLFDITGFDGVLIRAEAPEKLKEHLYDMPGVVTVEVMSETIASWEELMKLFYALMGVILVISLIIAAALTFNTITINVVERRREIATLRTLGMNTAEVIQSITIENLAMFLLSIPLGFILGYCVLGYLLSLFEADLFVAIPHVYLTSLASTTLGVLVAILVAELPSLRYMLRLDLPKITKERVT